MYGTRLIYRIQSGEVVDKHPTFDEFSAAMYSRRNCRHCHARGWQRFNMDDGTDEVRACRCVERRLAEIDNAKKKLVYKVSGPDMIVRHYHNKFTNEWSKTCHPLTSSGFKP